MTPFKTKRFSNSQRKERQLFEGIDILSFRGVPDLHRWEFLLTVLKLSSSSLEDDFNVAMAHAWDSDLETSLLKEITPARAFIKSHTLTAKGLENLELIIHVLNKRKMIEFNPILINVASLLLVYMPAFEVLGVLQALIDKSTKQFADPK